MRRSALLALLVVAVATSGCVTRRLIRQGDERLATGRPCQAVESYAKALARKPALEADELFAAQYRSANAECAFERGVEALDKRRLEEAAELFESALEYEPGMDKARERLSETNRDIVQADKKFDIAKTLANESKWDEALSALDGVLELNSTHAGAPVFAETVRRRAVADYVKRGDTALKKGDLLAAYNAYERCDDYIKNDPKAREGLARVDVAHGDKMLAQRRWGAAYLWYRQANIRAASAERLEAANAMEQRIGERLAFALNVRVDGDDDRVTALSSDLTNRLREALSRTAPAFMAFGVNESRPLPGALAAVGVELRGFDIRQAFLRKEGRTHRYTVYHQVDNPELPRIAYEIERTERERDRLRWELDRLCPVCRGDRDHVCSHCRGAGHTRCDRCDGTGAYYRSGKKEKCRDCDGSGRRDCRFCRHGRVACHRCNGTGLYSRVSRLDIMRVESDLSRLERDYRRAPATVLRGFPAEWPYTINHYEKRATAEALVRFDGASDKVTTEEAVALSAVANDKTIDNANPEIGLREDPLTLPTDDALRSDLARRGADQLARLILVALLKPMADEADEQTARAKEAGATLDAIEAGVDRMMLLRPIDRREADRALRPLVEAIEATRE